MVATILSVCICAAAFIVALISLVVTRSDKKDNDKEDFIKVNLKLDQICSQLTEMRVEQKTLSQKVNDLDKQVYKMQADIKTAFVRIDELKEREK